jgi:TRAP-type mannitol/chloroaromatic compound transport system substrate-binding protein
MKKILIFSLACLLCVGLPIIASAASEGKTIKWDLQTLLPAGIPMHKDIFLPFADQVRAASGGRLDITVHPAGAIVGTFEMFDAVSKGVFQAYMANPVYWSGKDAGFAALGSPTMGFSQVWQLDAWYWQRGGIELARKLYAKHNLHFIPINYGPDSIHSKKRISSAGDFKGLKFRTPQGMAADLFAELGASIVVIPGGETYSALEKGIVEGAEWGSPDLHSIVGWHEVTEYIIYPAFHQPTNGNEVTVNMDAWKKLPDDLKAIFADAVAKLGRDMMQYMAVRDYIAMEKMVAYGNKWVEMSPEELVKIQKLALKVWDKWAAKSPAAQEIINSQRDFMKLLGIIKE